MLRTRPEFLSEDDLHLIHASSLRVMRDKDFRWRSGELRLILPTDLPGEHDYES